MKNQSKGFAWIIALVVVALLAGAGTYVALRKPSPSTTSITEQSGQTQNGQTTTQNNTTSDTGVRLEFPWGQYGSSVNVRGASTSSKVVAQTINIGGFSKATLVIGKAVNIGGGSTMGSIYAFDSLNIAADSKIEKLYVESGTSLQIGRNVTIGEKVVLSHNDLVTQAEAAAGANVQGTTSTNTSSQGSTNTGTGTQTNTGGNVSVGITVASFTGEWNGTYASSPLVSAACKASGAVSFSMSSTGSVTGYATINGVKTPGTGKVDANGNLTGSWNYSGTNLNYSGKINSTTNSGSGSYQNALGCYGTFSVNR